MGGVDKEDRLATPVEDTVTCPVTAPKDRSATTAARLDISQETAQLRTTTSVLATSASSQVTSRLSAPTKLPSRKDTLRPTNEPTSDENPNFRERYACRTTTRYDTPDSLWKGWLAEIEDLTMTSFHQTAGLLCITKHYLSRFPSRCFLSLRPDNQKIIKLFSLKEFVPFSFTLLSAAGFPSRFKAI